MNARSSPSARDPRRAFGSPRTCVIAAALAFFATLAFQLSIPRPTAVLDDGGITLRYAERIASGLGFGYGTTGSVNGASNPLYTFLLAAILWLGVSPWNAVLGLGATCLAAGAAFVAWAFARWYSIAAAVFAVAAVATNGFFSAHVVSGLESPLSILLAMATFHALHTRSQIWIGVCLGLLVANKLDGALAAVAYAAVHMARERRFPVVAATVALVTALPVAADIWHAFGTLLPGAALTKIGTHESTAFDRTWIARGIMAYGGSAKIGVLALFASALFAFRRHRSLAFSVVWFWCVALVLAYSLVDLGDPYPWYVVPPLALAILLAAMLLQACLDLGLAWTSGRGRAWLGTIVVTALAGAAFASSVERLVRSRPVPHQLHTFTLVDAGRQVAGAWLRENAPGDELFATPFGLPAYEYGGPVYDTALLNNRPDPELEDRAAYAILEVAVGPPPAAWQGRELVAFFRMAPNVAGFALYADASSEVARNGARFVPGRTPTGRMSFDPNALACASPALRRRLVWWVGLVRSDAPPVW